MNLTDNKKFESELETLNKLYLTLIESDKLMAQTGSIQQKSEVAIKEHQKINDVINSFNQRSAEILGMKASDEMKNYTDDYSQKLVKQYSDEHLSKYRPEAETILKDALSWLNLSLNQKEEIRFPLRTSTDSNKAQLGEMKSLRAQNFLNAANNNPELILNELFNSLRSNDSDYFNSLVNLILIQEPRDEAKKSALFSDKPELENLFAKAKTVYRDFADKNNIPILDIAIVTLTTIATEANSFLASMNDNNLYYMPQRMVEKMDQNEVARNLDVVNSSAPYWGTKLDALTYVHQIV